MLFGADARSVHRLPCLDPYFRQSPAREAPAEGSTFSGLPLAFITAGASEKTSYMSRYMRLRNNKAQPQILG